MKTPGEQLMDLMQRRREINEQMVPENPEDRYKQRQVQLQGELRDVDAQIARIMDEQKKRNR